LNQFDLDPLLMKHLHRAGLVVAASIPIFILPSRIAEGQLSNPYNLIGSEIVIFLMGLACWYTIIYIQDYVKLPLVIRILLSIIACCVFSNIFYFTFNPFFKDFPYRTTFHALHISILLLCSRGVLMSVIIIPAAYYLKRDQEAKFIREQNQRLLMEKYQIQNTLLEKTVSERTYALQQTLSFLEESQSELEHQFFIQSRLIASITHDIRGPFKFLVQVSEEVSRLAAQKDDETLQLYTRELSAALENMFKFVKNLLEFTKLPLKDQVSRYQTVNLYDLIAEKAGLFEGILKINDNELKVDVQKAIHVKSNHSLLGIVVHNLIDNANRYSRSGQIEISVSDTDKYFILSVVNSGFPIPDHVAAWINADKESQDDTAYLAKGQDVGIGLVLIKDVSKILGMKVTVRTEQNATIFELFFKKDDHENFLITDNDVPYQV
jgi:signal transduction histidine kinase